MSFKTAVDHVTRHRSWCPTCQSYSLSTDDVSVREALEALIDFEDGRSRLFLRGGISVRNGSTGRAAWCST